MEREFILILEKIQQGNLDASTYRKIQMMPDSERMLFHQFVKKNAPASLKDLPDFDSIWHDIQSDLPRSESNARLLYRLIPYAAAIIVGMASFFIGRSMHTGTSEKQEIVKVIAPMGTLSEVRLPDNSRVWLNAGSELQYDHNFNLSNRNINLKGEAFFQIKENSNKPLVVTTNSMEITVTGTTFFVNAYESNEKVTAGLIEGKIFIYPLVETHAPLELNAKQKVQFDENHLSLEEVTLDDYSWREGILVFDDLPLSEITKRLENFYNRRIVLEGRKTGDLRFSITVKDEPLDEILQLLSLAAPIQYRQDEQLNYIISKHELNPWSP